MNSPRRLAATYILPIRRERMQDDDLPAYLEWLSERVEVLVVDGSPAEVFASHRARWPAACRHIAPDPDLRCANGKVWGVNTGLRHASHDRVVIGDDDVRYDDETLERVVSLLDRAEVVRPQNYFAPTPWHARWDTARTLLARALGGDWPGTLALRRDVVDRYDGDVLFENLELCRTVEAAGGRHLLARDLYVLRRPPSARHFWSQRVRQAYDEFARPPILVAELAILPAVILLLAMRRERTVVALGTGSVALAEWGRRRAGGARYFSWWGSLAAPAWLLERGVCSWLAVWQRVRHGGVRYSSGVLAQAANSRRDLQRRATPRG